MPYRSIRAIIEHQDVISASGDMTVAGGGATHEGAPHRRADDRGGWKARGHLHRARRVFRVVAENRDARTTPLAEVMTRNAQTIHPDKAFPDALRLMYEGGFRHVPVVEDGRPWA